MEYIKTNGAEYACKAVVTGVDSISFSMEGQAVADVEKAFRPVTELTVGMFRIEAEVANQDRTRQIGLMNRTQMPTHHGMLFVFDEPSKPCMWMRNTLLPLSVAFLDEQGKIINIEEMQPQTDDHHCAKKTARFALEMNKNWFAKRNIKAGDLIEGTKSILKHK